MSNTSSNTELNPNRLVVYYSPTVLTIIAGGRHRRLQASEAGPEFLQQVYETARTFKQTAPEAGAEAGEEHVRAGKALAEYMDPDFRRDLGDGLLQDLQGGYYLTDLPHLQIPPAIKAMLDRYRERGIATEPVMNLWKLALDNPNAQARTDLMDYIERFGIPVTDSGYMILYKSVRNKNKVIEKLAYTVGQQYFEKMRRWDQNPRDWWVYELPAGAIYGEESERFFVSDTEDVVYEREADEQTYRDVYEGSSLDEEEMETLTEEVPLLPLGNLVDLFKELIIDKQDLDPTEAEAAPVWEPFHRGPYGQEIRLGQVVTMPRDECDPSINRDCSKGLHVGSYEYVHTFRANEGSVLACLVNPRDIVALPETDHSKIRTCAYMPYGIISTDAEGGWEEAETTYWEEDFLDYEKQQLDRRIQDLRAELERAPERSAARIEEMLALANDRLVILES